MKTIGTLAWATASGGTTSAAERRTMIARAVPMQLRAWAADLQRALGLALRRTSLSLDQLTVPDTAMARVAEETCTSVSPVYLLNHCCRSFFWGALLASIDGTPFDAELLYVAALLHDIGLTSFAPSSEETPCFAISGARAARTVVLEHGFSEGRADDVADCIGQHCNVEVASTSGSEAQLLRAATAFDVIGQRYYDVSPDDVAGLLRRFPREDFKRQFSSAFGQEARREGTRAAFLVGRLQFLGRIQASPFPE